MALAGAGALTVCGAVSISTKGKAVVAGSTGSSAAIIASKALVGAAATTAGRTLGWMDAGAVAGTTGSAGAVTAGAGVFAVAVNSASVGPSPILNTARARAASDSRCGALRVAVATDAVAMTGSATWFRCTAVAAGNGSIAGIAMVATAAMTGAGIAAVGASGSGAAGAASMPGSAARNACDTSDSS